MKIWKEKVEVLLRKIERLEKELKEKDIIIRELELLRKIACKQYNDACTDMCYQKLNYISLKEENDKLHFMIKNGLGWEDMKNDISEPH